MSITVVPTLAFMADVYRRSAAGGPRSDRFRAYEAAGAQRVPVHGYNPMTTKAVLPAIEAFLAIDAEERLAEAANRTAASMGFADDATMHLTVATPGMWTDDLATEVEHRLLARDPGGVLLWFDQPVSADSLDAAAVAQAVRLVTVARHGPPTVLADAVAQEGAASARAGGPAELDDAAADALAVLADDPSLSTMVAFLYGDDAADALGFTPIGLGPRVGERHATAIAQPPVRPRRPTQRAGGSPGLR